MQDRFLYATCVILAITDLLLINIAFFFSVYIDGDGSLNWTHDYKNHFINVNLIWLITGNIFQLYNKTNIKSLEEIFRGTWKSVSIHILLFLLITSVIQNREISKLFLSLFYIIFMFNLLISRFACTLLELIIDKKFRTNKHVAVLDLNHRGLKLASFFETHQNQYSFQGFLDYDDSLLVDAEGNLLPATCAQIKRASEKNIKEVYVSLDASRMSDVGLLISEAEKQCVRLKFVPDFDQAIDTPFTINYMGDFPIFSIKTEPLENIDNRFKKRVVDIIFSFMVIVFLLSWLIPLLALIIKFESRGPVIFKQLRSGRDNSKFYCYKLRSMRVNFDSDKVQATKNDQRTTYFGKFLRKTSLDELPQFYNVLLGNMSVVGPRPHMIQQTEEYRSIISKYMVRHHLKPGITGWAQVRGFRGQILNEDLMAKRVEHDIWYLNNWSMMLDVRIVFLTIINIIRGEENAY